MMALLTKPPKNLIAAWIGWVAVILLYQVLVSARLEISKPDFALAWTPEQTGSESQTGKPFLNEPFLNDQVAWDSEYYLAIATYGYEEPSFHRINASADVSSADQGIWPFKIPVKEGDPILPGIPISYAFFPFYPFLMRLLSYPLSLIGLNEIATASLAGVMISTLGTLLGIIALFELAREELGEEGGWRAVFYLLIFPSAFFMAQVYTEGLFIGLAFSSLVLIRKGKRGWAAVLAVCATLTRAVGIALVLPLLISWIRENEWRELDLEWRQLYYQGLPWRVIGNVLVVLAPALAFLIWKISYYGMAFSQVEALFFGRGLLSLDSTYISWKRSFQELFGSNPQASAYYMLEWGALILGFITCGIGLKKYPGLAVYGFAVVLLSFTSGPAQGMHRYILTAPPVFIELARWGRNKAFDWTWTIFSILNLGILAALFTFNMWAG